ncbi:MAG: putative HemY protein [Pseudomonadota bacterium]|jgi:heme biosynthesis-associated TPR repeat protein
MMRWLITSILLMVLFSLLTQFLLQDPGFVMIVLGNSSLEMRFWPALLCWLVFWLLLSLCAGLLKWLLKGLRGGGWRAAKVVGEARLHAAWLHYFEGEWARLLKESLRALKRKPDLIPSLLAAEACANLGESFGEDSRIHQLLSSAQTQHPKQTLAIALVGARIALAQGNQTLALAWLNQGRTQAPRSKNLLKLLAQTLHTKGDWPEVAALLPELAKARALDEPQYAELEAHTLAALIASAAQTGLEALQNSWTGLNKHQKQTPQLLLAYARGLQKHGRGELAEPLTRKALNRTYHAPLAALYGTLEGINPQQQLKEAQNWHQQHPNELSLLISLAQLCIRLHYWGQARDYWEAAHQQAPSARSYLALAELYTKLGDKAKSQELYERGLTRLAEIEASL